jgi:diacylglycerol kinase family enzyme
MFSPMQRPRGPVGVVLNANAGSMTPRLARAIRGVAGPEHVFFTESKDHAEEALRACVEREYPTVFAGGGDGTIVDAINTLATLSGPKMPNVGVLRLGTGNALARWLGSGNPVETLARYQRGETHQAVMVRMVTTGKALTPFLGLGHDAAVLNDYYRVKRALAGTALAPLGHGLAGYFIAGLGITLPNFLTRKDAEVSIINMGSPARRIGLGGDEVGPEIPAGELLYRGPIATVGAATTPQLGYGVRFFPHALRRPGRFHLRAVALSPFGCVRAMPDAWRGTLHHPDVHDFYADRVRLIFSQPMAFQVAGDPAGFRDEVTFGLSENPVTFVGQA